MPIKYLNRNNNTTVLAGTQKAIFGYGYTTGVVSITNLVGNTGVVATDTTGVGTSRWYLAAAGYGSDKAIFGYGTTAGYDQNYSITNLVSNTGVVSTDTTGIGTTRRALAAAGYGTDKAIFGYGYTNNSVSIINLVSNTGVVATDTSNVNPARHNLAAAGYGVDKAIFGYGQTSAITNLVSNTGVVASDTAGVGTARFHLAAAGYGTDKAIFGYGQTSGFVSMTNLVSNTGVVATDTTGVGTARKEVAATGYGSDKAIFGYGTTGTNTAITNLVSNTGVVATDTTGVGTARQGLAAAEFSITTVPAPGGIAYKNRSNSGTATPTGKSVQFNGTNQYLSVGSVANWAFLNNGSTPFTIEAWVNPTSVSTSTGEMIVSTTGYQAQIGFYFQIGNYNNGDVLFAICVGNSQINQWATSDNFLTANNWTHVAVSFTPNGTNVPSATVKFFVNGILATSSNVYTRTTTYSTSNPTNTLLVGAYQTPFGGYFPGKMSNLRILNGTALYTTNFTPPTAPLTAIANTALLTCNADTIIDGSTNNFTITNNNSATVSSTTPFTVATATSTVKMKKVYSDAGISIITSGLVLNLDASNASSYPGSGTSWFDLSGNSNNGTLTNGPTFNSANGGSIVFDGSDDYVQVINGYTNTLKNNNNWSVSFWFKANSLSNDPVLLGPEVGQLNYYDLFLEVGINSIYFGAGGGSGVNYLTNSSVSLAINTIYNIVYIKTGITTGKVFLNGIEVPLSALGTGLGSMPNSNADFRIGTFKAGSFSLNGNIYQTLIYNKSLSAPEVLQNYNVTKAKFGL